MLAMEGIVVILSLVQTKKTNRLYGPRTGLLSEFLILLSLVKQFRNLRFSHESEKIFADFKIDRHLYFVVFFYLTGSVCLVIRQLKDQ